MDECMDNKSNECVKKTQQKIEEIQQKLNTLQNSLNSTHVSFTVKSAKAENEISILENKLRLLKEHFEAKKVALKVKYAVAGSVALNKAKDDVNAGAAKADYKISLEKAREEAMEAAKEANEARKGVKNQEKKTIKTLKKELRDSHANKDTGSIVLNNMIKSAERRSAIKSGIKKRVQKAVEKLESNNLKNYPAQLIVFDAAKAQAEVARKIRIQKSDEKLTENYVKEKVHSKAVSYTYNHYKEYLTTCQNKVTSCVSFCGKKHLFNRTTHENDSVTYECGGFNHSLLPCNAKGYMREVKSVRTCSNACIKEGRCLTFFKNEYYGIHSTCAKVKEQCNKYFCPGSMMKGHLPCLIKCGGGICSYLFQAESEMNLFMNANDIMVHHNERAVALDKIRPKAVSQ